MQALDLFKHRFEMAKDFSKDFHEQVKQAVKDYNADQPDKLPFVNVDYVETINRRYAMVIPLIFTNHEAMLASLFDRPPEIIIGGRGGQDEDKRKKAEAAYQYLVDKLDIPTFMNNSAWWFILAGMATAHASYVKETYDVPQLDEDGEPLNDELGNPVMMTKFKYDDPILEAGDPLKLYFSPESEYTIDASKVPYYCKKELMTVDEVEATYGIKVEPDAELETNKRESEKKDVDKSDNKRVTIYRYWGTVPSEVKDEEYDGQQLFDDWSLATNYYAVYTAKQPLYIEKIDDKNCTLLKWFGAPNEFYGFGIAKLLRPFQKEKSIRRGQMMRLGDVAAFPKLAVPMDAEYDQKAIQDPREVPTITYDSKTGKPEYMAPPNMSDTLNILNQEVDKDAQSASGMMDLSAGAQNTNTVDTATGQTIFAEAAERRMRMAKRKYVRFYRQTIIMLLKLAQKYWDEDKLVTITDEQGHDEELTVTRYDLQDIDFDKDLDINEETLTVNKDVLREQAISLYNIIKDDPLIERKEVFKDVLTQGFNKTDPDRYIKEMGLEPGRVLLDPMSNEEFVVDETGELVPKQQMQQMADPSQNQTPQTQAGVLNSI
jgi:hypothetical protein